MKSKGYRMSQLSRKKEKILLINKSKMLVIYKNRMNRQKVSHKSVSQLT